MSFKKFVKEVGLIGFTEIFVAFGGITLIPILTKTLGAYGYGLWTQVIVTITLLSPFASFGLNNALVRFLPATKTIKEKQEIFFSIFILKFFTSLLISLLLILFSKHVANAIFDGDANVVILTGFLLIINGSNILCQFYFRGLRQIKIYSIIRILVRYFEIGLAYYMILSGHGILGAISGLLAVRSLFFLISLILIIKQIGVCFPHFTGMKTWLQYGIPLIPTSISLWVISASDRYIIGYILGVSYVGSYSAAYIIGFYLIMIMQSINFVLVPALSKLFDEGKIQEVKKYLRYVFKYFLIFAIPAIFGISIFSKQLLSIMTTPVIAGEAWMVMPIIVTAALFSGVVSVFDKALRLAKKTSRVGLVIMISAVINLSLNLMLIPSLGIIGAAVATLISYVLSAGIMIYFSIKIIRFEIENAFIIKAVFASILMAFIGWIWHPVNLLNLILCILVCIFIYFFILFLLGVFKREEIKFFKTFLKIG